MADEILLLQQARHLAGQLTATEQNTLTIFAALLGRTQETEFYARQASILLGADARF